MKYSLYYDVSTLGTDNVWYYVVDNTTNKAYTTTDLIIATTAVKTRDSWPINLIPDGFTHHICNFNTLEHLQQSMPELFL